MGHISPAEKTDHYKRVLDQRDCIRKGGNAASKGLNERYSVLLFKTHYVKLEVNN